MVLKKGVFFTIDALIAISLLGLTVFLLYPFEILELNYENLDYAAQDFSTAMSNLKINEVRNDYIQGLIENGTIENSSEPVIQFIGDLWVNGKEDIAANIIANMTQVLPDDMGYGLWINDQLIFYHGVPSNNTIIPSRSLVSGINKTLSTTGYTTKVYLSNIASKKTSSFLYFGGYVGEGNITKKFILPGNVSMQEAYLELDVTEDFDFYINEAYSGTFTEGSSGGGYMKADKWNVSAAYLNNFNPGENEVNLRFHNGWAAVSGGYLRATYQTSELGYKESYNKSYLPGVKGLINVYSSFYVPGNITNMTAKLHYDINLSKFVNQSLYLSVGSEKVFVDNTSETEQNVQFNISLNYSDYSGKTVPIRVGLSNLNFTIPISGVADVVLITDLSGSMDKQLDNNSNGVTRNCDNPLLNSSTTRRISLAKCLDKDFIDIILNSTGNRVALVSYSAHATIDHNLSEDQNSLEAEIDSYSTGGATCVACAVRAARLILERQSNASRLKFIIVMTDGVANTESRMDDTNSTEGCDPNACSSTNSCGSDCYRCVNPPCLCLDCSFYYVGACGDYVGAYAINQSIYEACYANNITSTTIHSIGFGGSAASGCDEANRTLREIAVCGQGNYTSSTDANELAEIYRNFAQEIVVISKSQAALISGGMTPSILYSDSYLEFDYIPDLTEEFGKISVSLESPRFGNELTSGTINIGDNFTITDFKVSSYSADKWTSVVWANNVVIYNLSRYSDNYLKLGDPFLVNIPIQELDESNDILIKTAYSFYNISGGSIDNKAFYTINLPSTRGYAEVYQFNEGCNWTINYEDGDSGSFLVPNNYDGTRQCNYKTRVYWQNNSIDMAIYSLLSDLDLDDDGEICLNIDENGLDVKSVSIPLIPYLWGPAVVEFRTWK